ncbi:hypothetical protein CR152_10485 [Massilia violaceinigra]|uniref:Uncharacterized protein n=1 Tax=Massilia violaceinigra TaxID=2045208 RepID=A0A2D2DIU5_9BURK|nr:TorF family putative porin [Massilia violaceinigra]ATQ74904.1 hypothetical protein CR152_10485 [Massilia violaceinigra]
MKIALLAALLSFAAQAASAATEFSLNAALTSDYRYRGISQTRLQPALQGGADLVHKPSGWYAGAWTSTIKWTSDAGGKGKVELDIYGGKRGELAPGIGYDAGILTYVYPSNKLGRVPGLANANTTEAYGQLSWGIALVKYSRALTNLFGYVDSKRSGYLDLAANPDLGNGLVLNLHAGRQRVAHNSAASYTDYKIGMTKDFAWASVALAAVGSTAAKAAYASPANGSFLGKRALLLTVSKTF